jgi:outer membrane lipoprotein-sorting protein
MVAAQWVSEELAQRIKVRDMKLSRRGRWAVPAVAVAATGGIIAGSAVTIAQAAPALPAKTPAQLLADVAANQEVPPLTGTVVETTSLGLPQLPQTGNPTSLSSLLTGSHTVKVYWENAQHFRLAIPQSMSETDLIRNGSTAWLWDSTRNAVTKINLPANTGEHLMKRAPMMPAAAPLTPQQAANQVLAAVGKTTTVRTQTNVTVAGEAAYQLVLAPKDSQSTIGSIQIAIDGKTGVPLRVQVFAKGATTPAFQVGYTSISYVTPAPANLAFTPPPGATVTTEGAGSGHAAAGSAPDKSGMGTYGSGWTTVAELPQSDLLPSGTGGASSAQPPSSSGGMLGGSTQEVLNAILGSAKPVSGSWGSGELLHTSLLNVLITGGAIYVGAVQPSVLYSAVGHATTG